MRNAVNYSIFGSYPIEGKFDFRHNHRTMKLRFHAVAAGTECPPYPAKLIGGLRDPNGGVMEGGIDIVALT